MFQWIRTEASKLGFDVVIGRPNNGTGRKLAFVTLRCARSGKYTTLIWKLKRDDIDSRKCDCPFKLHGYLLENNK